MSELQSLDGPEASERLAEVLERVRLVVPYLKADVGRPEASDLYQSAKDGWFSSREVLDDPVRLDQVLRASAASLGTENLAVTASLWVQGYAYRILTLAVACLCVEGVVPDSNPDRLAVGSSRGRPSLLVYTEPALALVPGPADRLVQQLSRPAVADSALRSLIATTLEGHLAPLIGAVHDRVRVGERLLWGNAASSAAMAFRTMQGALGRWVIPLGERFFDLAPASLAGLGSYLLIENDDRYGWFWERTNCCLFDLLPGKPRCSDCSRTPPGERHAAYERSLAGERG